MCSVNDDEGEELMREPDVPAPKGDACHKCGAEGAPFLLQAKFKYCGDCLRKSVVHKFRLNFGKSRTCRTGAKVLIAHSGGLASSVLLRLVSEYATLKFAAHVLHVDEGAVRGADESRRKEAVENAKRTVEPYGYPFYVASLGDAASPDRPAGRELALNADEDAAVRKLLESAADPTSRRELRKRLKRLLYLRCAADLGCSHVMLAEATVDLATDTLVSVCRGGGAHVAEDVGFADERCDVKILRPMKEISPEEIDYFAQLNGINGPPSAEPSDNDIQGRIERFIQELGKNFPSTIATVLRTANKLEVPDGSGDTNRCVLCQSTLGNSIAECSSVQATGFSKIMSSNNGEPSCANDNNQSCGSGSCCRKPTIPKKEELKKTTCYRCGLIINDIKDIGLLPSYIHSSAKVIQQRSAMKEAIQDYLIE